MKHRATAVVLETKQRRTVFTTKQRIDIGDKVEADVLDPVIKQRTKVEVAKSLASSARSQWICGGDEMTAMALKRSGSKSRAASDL